MNAKPETLDAKYITLAHGNGGRLMRELIERSRARLKSDTVFDLEKGHGPQSPRLRRIVNPSSLHPAIWEYVSDAIAADIAADLLGPNVKFLDTQMNFKWARGGTEIKWHQDIPYFPHTNYSLLTIGTFLEDVSKGNFQMYSLSRNGIADPDFYFVIFYSKNIPPEGQNRGYYNNPRIDQLILEGRSTFDRTKRRQIYSEIQRIVQEDLPYVSLYHQINVAVMEKDLQGYVMYPAGFWLGIPQMSRKPQ